MLQRELQYSVPVKGYAAAASKVTYYTSNGGSIASISYHEMDFSWEASN